MRSRPTLLMDIGARSMVPTLVVVSVYLLIVGHDEPGGGFIGGLLAGISLLVVFLAGGAARVTTVLPLEPLTIVGVGMSVAAATSIAGMIFGAGLLDAGKLDVDLPWIGKISVGSTLAFDAGVYLIVVGLVAMVLTRLGSRGEAAP